MDRIVTACGGRRRPEADRPGQSHPTAPGAAADDIAFNRLPGHCGLADKARVTRAAIAEIRRAEVVGIFPNEATACTIAP